MKSQSNYLNPEDFGRLLRAAANVKLYGSNRPDDLVFLFEIMYWCSLRVGEALRVTAAAIDGEARTVYLGKTKTKKNDIAVMPPELMEPYDKWLESRRARGVGVSEPIVTLKPTRIRRILRRIGEENEIMALRARQSDTGEKVGTHIFRKSLAKDMLMGTHGPKAPINTVASMLRHESIVTTSKYLRQDSAAARDYWDGRDGRDGSAAAGTD